MAPLGGAPSFAWHLGGRTLITEPSARLQALRSEWAPVFARKPFAAQAAAELVEKAAVKADFTACPPPTLGNYCGLLRRIAREGDGGPGPE